MAKKLSDLLVDYTLNTPPVKVGLKTAKEYLSRYNLRDAEIELWEQVVNDADQKGAGI